MARRPRIKKTVTIEGNRKDVNVRMSDVFLSPEFLQGWKSVRKNITPNWLDERDYSFGRGRQFAVLHPEFNQIREGTKVYLPAFQAYKAARLEKLIL